MTQFLKTFSRFTTILMLLWLFVIGLLVTPLPKASAATCVVTLGVEHITPQAGPYLTYTSIKTLHFSSSDKFVLHWSLANCNQAVIENNFTVTVQSNNTAPVVVAGGVANNNSNGYFNLTTPNGDARVIYEIFVRPAGSSANTNTVASSTFPIYYVLDNPPTPNDQGIADYTPNSIKICKVSDTASTIFWTTKSKTNSALEFSELGNNTPTPKVYNTPLIPHSIPLTGLKKNTDYGFDIWAPVSGASTSTTSSHRLTGFRQFKTGETNDNGCNNGQVDQTNSNTNSAPPNNSLPNNAINTGITANISSLDTVLGTFFNPLQARSVPELIGSIIRVLFLLVGIAAVIIIIIAGFRMVLASGNESELTNAKKAITWAIVGLIVSLMAFSIVAIIQNLISRQ